MTRTGAAILIVLAPAAGGGGADMPAQDKRMCGRVVSAWCEGPSTALTLRVQRSIGRDFRVMLPAASRESFGRGVEDRYVDRTVCVDASAVKDRVAVVESPAGLEITAEPKATLPPLPTGVYEACDPGIQPPEVLKDVKPQYPFDAMRRDGTIVLRAIVAADGRIAAAVVVQGLSRSLDDAALTALKGWRFKPAALDGAPVPVAVRIEFSFQVR